MKLFHNLKNTQVNFFAMIKCTELFTMNLPIDFYFVRYVFTDFVNFHQANENI